MLEVGSPLVLSYHKASDKHPPGDAPMSKKRVGENSVNRSQAIRDIFGQNPRTPTAEVVSTLAAKGIKVKPSLIYFVKRQMRRNKRRQIGKRMAEAGLANPVDLILKVRSLAAQAGGMSKLKQLVDALAE
jgi:hypothetical protein